MAGATTGARRSAASLLVAGVLAALVSCGRSHDAADRRLDRVAADVGADRGQVVHRAHRSDGVFGQGRSLVVVTLRRGDRDQVLGQQVDALVAAGYRSDASSSRCVDHPDQQCTFTEPATLPYASLVASGAGTTLFYEDAGTTRVVEVPGGQTGIRLVLSDENPPPDDAR